MAEASAPAADGQGAQTTNTSSLIGTEPINTAVAPAATSTVVAPPIVQQPTAKVPWLGEADETTLGYVANKGWDNGLKAVESYRNLEKLLGADKAGNAVVIPKGDAPKAEWDAVWNRLGRPTGPDGYKVAVPEGGNVEFHNTVLSKMHEIGLPKQQGEALATWLTQQGMEIKAQTEAQKAVNFQNEVTTVQTEWGAAYEQNKQIAAAAARGLGLDGAMLDKMSEGIGHKATMELLHKIGTRMEEPSFKSGDNIEKFGNALTPGQAKATIQARMADKDWINKYRSGGMNSVEFKEMQQLQAWANPE